MKKALYTTIISVCMTAGQGLAEDPPPYPDFTFKREKAPKPGETRKITIQIAPEANVPSLPVTTAGTGAGAKSYTTNYEWFWQGVPSELDQNPYERFNLAVQTLQKPPRGQAVHAPRLQLINEIVQSEGIHILRETVGKDISPALVLAVIAVESAGKSDAVSHKGAQGLMQLIPATAERFGVKDSLKPADNIKGGVAYLDWLLKEFEGDAILALAGYNAGENAVKNHGGVPPFEETRDYVPKVLAAYEVAKGLCLTRPVLFTDGCALNLALKAN